MNALFCEDELAHTVVVEGDKCVRKNGQLVERRFRLFAAAAAFEEERHGCENDHESSLLAGDAGDDRSRSGTGSAAEAGAEKYDTLPLECFPNLIFCFKHRLLP